MEDKKLSQKMKDACLQYYQDKVFDQENSIIEGKPAFRVENEMFKGWDFTETIKLREELDLAYKNGDEEKIYECLAKIREHFPDMFAVATEFAVAAANKELKKEKNYFDITFTNDIGDEELNKKAKEDYLADKKNKIKKIIK
jgi:hypothetical protein